MDRCFGRRLVANFSIVIEDLSKAYSTDLWTSELRLRLVFILLFLVRELRGVE